MTNESTPARPASTTPASTTPAIVHTSETTPAPAPASKIPADVLALAAAALGVTPAPAKRRRAKRGANVNNARVSAPAPDEDALRRVLPAPARTRINDAPVVMKHENGEQRHECDRCRQTRNVSAPALRAPTVKPAKPAREFTECCTSCHVVMPATDCDTHPVVGCEQEPADV